MTGPGGPESIRWDGDRMRELAAHLEVKSERLEADRRRVHEALVTAGPPRLELRALVLAAAWCRFQAQQLQQRRALLIAAESRLLSDLDQELPTDQYAPQSGSRRPEAIIDELDTVLTTLRGGGDGPAALDGPNAANGAVELRIAELIYELAVARRSQLLLAATLPEPSTLVRMQYLLDVLAYEIVIRRPRGAPSWSRAAAALADIRRRLDESWFGDVGRGDLLGIHETLADLAPADLDFVIGGLSDAELYRWFRELDGLRGGNLAAPEQSELFADLARRANAAMLFRLATAERAAKFAAIATAVRTVAPDHTAMEFIEICAAHATGSDAALVAALAGLVELEARPRRVVLTKLVEADLIAALSDATSQLLQQMAAERDDPVVVEFFEGVAAAVTGAVTTVAELTVVGLVDGHRFREAWSDLAKMLGLAGAAPLHFLAVALDVGTLRRNPARWLGEVFADIAGAGVGRAARVGRLGRAARRVTRWIEQLDNRVVLRGGRWEVEAGQIVSVLDQLGASADGTAVAAAIARLEVVESYSDELSELTSQLAAPDPAPAITRLAAMAAAARGVIDGLHQSVAAVLATLGQSHPGAPIVP